MNFQEYRHFCDEQFVEAFISEYAAFRSTLIEMSDTGVEQMPAPEDINQSQITEILSVFHSAEYFVRNEIPSKLEDPWEINALAITMCCVMGAYILQHTVTKQVLINGNKRLGLLVIYIFFKQCGYFVQLDKREYYTMVADFVTEHEKSTIGKDREEVMRKYKILFTNRFLSAIRQMDRSDEAASFDQLVKIARTDGTEGD